MNGCKDRRHDGGKQTSPRCRGQEEVLYEQSAVWRNERGKAMPICIELLVLLPIWMTCDLTASIQLTGRQYVTSTQLDVTEKGRIAALLSYLLNPPHPQQAWDQYGSYSAQALPSPPHQPAHPPTQCSSYYPDCPALSKKSLPQQAPAHPRPKACTP